MLRLISPLFYVCLTLCGGALLPAVGQDKTPTPIKPATPEKTAADNKTAAPEKGQNVANKTPTAEQIAEGVIFAYGSRGVLDQIRHNGIERGRITRTTPEGRSEEISYERRFVRGADATKDKVRVDQKMPNME